MTSSRTGSGRYEQRPSDQHDRKGPHQEHAQGRGNSHRPPLHQQALRSTRSRVGPTNRQSGGYLLYRQLNLTPSCTHQTPAWKTVPPGNRTTRTTLRSMTGVPRHQRPRPPRRHRKQALGQEGEASTRGSSDQVRRAKSQ